MDEWSQSYEPKIVLWYIQQLYFGTPKLGGEPVNPVTWLVQN